MQYVIKAMGTTMYYSFKIKSWTISRSVTPMGATKFSRYNPLRFILKAYINFKYGPAEFYKLVPLKAKISMLGR